MNHCIMRRTPSIFGEQEWREVPWIGADKGVEQIILDYGLRLGGLLETADTLSKGELCSSDVATLLGELAEISDSIQNLHEHYSSPRKGSSTSASPKNHESQQAASPTNPPNLSPKIVALGIQLIACATGYAVALKATDPTAVASGFSVISSENPRPFDL